MSAFEQDDQSITSHLGEGSKDFRYISVDAPGESVMVTCDERPMSTSQAHQDYRYHLPDQGISNLGHMRSPYGILMLAHAFKCLRRAHHLFSRASLGPHETDTR